LNAGTFIVMCLTLAVSGFVICNVMIQVNNRGQTKDSIVPTLDEAGLGTWASILGRLESLGTKNWTHAKYTFQYSHKARIL